jgi:hypothetical protein
MSYSERMHPIDESTSPFRSGELKTPEGPSLVYDFASFIYHHAIKEIKYSNIFNIGAKIRRKNPL